MKRFAGSLVLCVWSLTVTAAMLFVAVPPATAGSKVVPVEGAKYVVTFTMSENIALFKDKHIKVLLASGQQLTGKVVDVNASYLHLAGLENENFLDALIKVDDIVAIKAQFRKYE